MDSLDYHQIKEYCREALEISDEYGVHDGLTYLIGEKFCPLLMAVKQAESRIKYMYNSDEEDSLFGPASGNDSTVMVESTFQKLQERLENLTRLRSDFVAEIKEVFEISDLQDFLNSYPRLGLNDKNQPLWEQIQVEKEDEASNMDFNDVLSEVDDIFMVEDLKKYFM